MPPSRRSTTISMLEEEFGMREGPEASTRFGAATPFPLTRTPRSNYLSIGLPPKLRILPPKRKKSTTQAPEPRRSLSFSMGTWETVWSCDVDDVDLVEPVESPLEDLDSPPGGSPSPDYRGDPDSELDQDVATPTNGNPWSSDGELTPLFSSNLPSALDSNPLGYEGRPGGELLESAPSPTEPEKP
jgi:hypothetical protein